MKTLIVAMLIIIVSTQTTISPKTQACVCSNLLNSFDCQAQTGCQWTTTNTTSNATNSTNTTITSTGKDQQQSLKTGTCANSTTSPTTVAIPTFCGSITNGTLCAAQVGCAYLNSTCSIFTGCSAYVKTTHQECQLISISCTTDGTTCALLSPCITYTTQALCVGSSGSTTKNCKWTPTEGSTGTCSDTICSDAPVTLSTDAQCNDYISGCKTTGKGCVVSPVPSCTTYSSTDGCSTRVGTSGKCYDTTPSSDKCREVVCTDAPSTVISDDDCTKFFPTGNCKFYGKGCLSSPLPACNTYLVTQTCESLIGLEGKCITDTANPTKCKEYTCADAPISFTSDDQCKTIKSTCITSGQGCTTSLSNCSDYIGTADKPCTSYKGLNGICKASTTTSCADRTCADDAAKLFTSNAQCDSYLKSCVTKGVGCIATRQPCENYTGTADECGKFIGTNGNCTFSNAEQAAGAACKVKACSDAPSQLKSNAECYSYSFQCASNNGSGCIEPGNCDTINMKELCQGKSSCSFNQVCLDRSTCANYTSQTLCIFNTQQYFSGSTYYERACTWNGTTCINQSCPTTSTLTKDSECQTALAGCLTTGAGCVDISANCASYKGLQVDCEKFKGINQTIQCTQDNSVTKAAECIEKVCVNAKKINGAQTSSANICETFTGCYFDGKDNCTNLDCSKYYGNQNTCKSFTTAIDDQGNKQYCWNTSSATATDPCVIRQCSDAPNTITDSQMCNTHKPGCVTNGNGCVDPSTSCTSYVGGSIDICSKFYENGQQCTGSSFCIPRTCQDTINSPNTDTCANYLKSCQFDGVGCVTTNQCSTYKAQGANDTAKTTNCQTLKDSTGAVCGFKQGNNNCSTKSCEDFFPYTNDAECKAYLPTCFLSATNTCVPIAACSTYATKGPNDQEKANFCKTLSDLNGTVCGYKSGDNCSTKSCDDIFDKSADFYCKLYLPTCYYSADYTCSATKTAACNTYAAKGQGDWLKASFCQALLDLNGAVCGYKSGDNCSAKSCDNFFFRTSDTDCKTYLPTCFLSADDTCSATKTAACNTYATKGEFDGQKAYFCQTLLDLNGAVCGYKSGDNCSTRSCDDIFTKTNDAACKAYLPTCYLSADDTCSATKTAACNTYATKGEFDSQKAAFCQTLLDQNGAVCGYKSGDNCSAKSCDDIFHKAGDRSCKQYLPTCYYSGIETCSTTTACNAYTTYGGDGIQKAAFCQTLSDLNGTICGYKSGNNCSARSCDDIFDKLDDAACKEYLSTCYLSAENTCSKVGAGKCDSYNAEGSDSTAKAAFCNAQIDNTGVFCGYRSGITCSDKSCSDIFTAKNDGECNSYLKSCKLNPNKVCNSKLCTDAPTSIKNNQDCESFRKGCVTNGAGCVDSAIAKCQDYKGDKTTCQKFTGSDGLCNNMTSGAACQLRNCEDNNNETSQDACDLWYPPQKDGTKNCIWNGTIGCIVLKKCDQIVGTIESCSKVQASDSPCSGTATSLSSGTRCVSNKTICNKAPTSYTTDEQCKKWHKECLSTGSGCITDSTDFCSNVVSATLCPQYKNDKSCDLSNQCLTKPSQCSDLKTAFECNNTILTGTIVTCGWNLAAPTPTCISLTCEQLPVTLTTDGACASALSLPNITCTTNGAGCLTKTTCSGYTYASACTTASTTDGKKCIWQNSVCRNIVCTDNTTAKSDQECDTYLKGCITIGTGCSNSLDCSIINTAALCLKDSSNNPCLWYQASATQTASCQRYTQCTDILQSTHQACQQVSPLCTTDGTKCIAITSCAKTSLQVSCVVGTDGTCGYLPASGTTPAACAQYTNCAAATGGNSLAACQAWGSTCVSDGTSCIPQTSCTGYLTEAACGNLGINATSTQNCIYSSGACRPQVCTDATATSVSAISTHDGCLAFPATTQCTTNGTNGCIELSTCSSYSQTVSAACVLGTDGPCFFQTTTTAGNEATPSRSITACRLKQCSDIIGTTSASCATAIIGVGQKCVSNGVTCIAQSTCSAYIAKEACLGGGSDGACVFTPGTNTTTPNVGTCQLFTACTQANQDQTACNSKSASCYFTPAPTNGTSSCTPHNCTTKASGSTCQAVPNFDLSQYQICVLAVGTTTCQPGTPSEFPQSTCYAATLATYTWNPSTNQCQSCQSTTTSNTINNTINTTNAYSYLLSLMITIAIMI